jgi:HEAT repeat protein
MVTVSRLRIRLAAVTAVALVFSAPASADTFLLDTGGQIQGHWLNREEANPATFQIRRAGVTITLAADRVQESTRQTPADLEYARRAPLAADTPQAQWDLAEWCRSAALSSERKIHLQRVIDLDPGHTRARQALGYMFLGGQWITKEDARRSEGYELYRGKWRTPQEIEILESRSRHELAEKEWLARLKKWRRDLDDPDKHRFAWDSLSAIRDPIAIPPLAQFFAKERVRKVKGLYADILAQINTPQAIQVLIDRALNDPDEEVFHYCLGTLAQNNDPRLTAAFITALRDPQNIKVNRGAVALARLGDKSAISPLIDALTTTHMQVVRQGLGAEATTSAFSNDGTFMKKGDGPEAIVYHIQNQPVLDALSKLTGANFGFDQRAWRTWYSQDKIARESAVQSALGNALRGVP